MYAHFPKKRFPGKSSNPKHASLFNTQKPLQKIFTLLCIGLFITLSIACGRERPPQTSDNAKTEISTDNHQPVKLIQVDKDVVKNHYIIKLKAKPLAELACNSALGQDRMGCLVPSQLAQMKYQINQKLDSISGHMQILGMKENYRINHSMVGMFVTATPEQIEQFRTSASSNTIDSIMPDHLVYHAQSTNGSWGLDQIDQSNQQRDGQFKTKLDGEGVHVYIIDSGLNAGHSEFRGRIGEGYSPAGYNHNEDCTGHGTHVAGIAAGTKWGVAKKATIHALRVFGCGSSARSSHILRAIDWVIKNKKGRAVINLSLGSRSRTNYYNNALRNATRAGITVVAAAGNSGMDACGFVPASSPDAITVGAVDSYLRRRYNYGRCVDIFAPGIGIRAASHRSSTGYRTLSGTSMASPYVAGAAALFLQANPNATPEQVKEKLKSLATQGILTSLNGGPNQLLNIALYGTPSNNSGNNNSGNNGNNNSGNNNPGNSGNNNPGGQPITKTHTISARVTTSPSYQHGSIQPSGQIKVKEGENQTFRFQANPGYKATYLRINDKWYRIDGSSFTFRNVRGNYNLVVYFQPSSSCGASNQCGSNEVCVEGSNGSQAKCLCQSGFERSANGSACVKKAPPQQPGINNCGMNSMEKEVLALVNQERKKYGLNPVQCHPSIVQASRSWSSSQCRSGRISHNNFSSRVRAIGLQYRSAGENVAAGYQTPEAVVRGWMNSSGHRKNILSSRFTHLGNGYVSCGNRYRHYWTQIFMQLR